MSIATEYEPVVRTVSEDGVYTAAALTGANTVIMGWNMDDGVSRDDLMGFAIRRTQFDPDTEEILRRDWLNGQKRFRGVSETAGFDVRSDQAPFQRFRWADYTVNASHAYRYEIFPMRGRPGDLTRDNPVVLDVRPSGHVVDGTGIFFNRGVTSASAYFRRFRGLHPDKIGDDAAYRWLSRGLKESLLAFIDTTKAGETLHVAIYEFFLAEIAGALSAAHSRGVNLHIVYHAKAGDKATAENEHNLRQAGLDDADLSTARTNTSGISHNKFVVRLNSSGRPLALWTASANFSNNAFHFQTNCALTFDDTTIAELYEGYFRILRRNLSARKEAGKPTLKDEIIALVQRFENSLPKPLEKVMFSPVREQHVVDAARELIGEARSAVFISAPFGLAQNDFHDALEGNPRDIIEYGLANASAIKKILSFNHHNTRFFPPRRLKSYMGETWDARAFGAHKIHAKTLVIDPWGDNPAVLIGSANFSKPSCTNNDENTLLFRGDKRIAAMVATEFLRMYEHYRARYWIEQIAREEMDSGRPADNSSWFLEENSGWSRTAFDPGVNSRKFRDRIVFSGGE